MVISGSHSLLGEVKPGDSFLFFFPLLFSHVRSSVGSTLGLLAIIDIVKARKVSEQMVTKRKFL